MKKILWLVAALHLLILPSVPAVGQPPKSTVKLGIILPLTGTAASWGRHMQNAAELAQSELAAEGSTRVNLALEDDQLKAASAVSAFNKLLMTDHIDALVVFGGQSVAAVAPLAEKMEIPMFGITANPALVTGKKFVLRHWLGSEEQMQVIVPEMVRLGYHKAAVVVTTHDGMLDYVSRFKSFAPGAGLKIVFNADYPPAENDFRSQLQLIRLAAPDVILMGLLPPQMSAFMKQLRDLQMTTPVFGVANAETESEIRASQGAMEGLIYSAPDLSEDFIKRYRARYGEYPELSAGNVFDIIKIVDDAARSGAVTAAAINTFIHSLRGFSGVLGTYDVTGNNDFSLKAVLKTVRQGEFVRKPLGGK